MKIKEKKLKVAGIRFFIKDGRAEIARAYLYIMKNDLHQRPFGFIEDVFVDEGCRGRGFGTMIINKIIKTAKDINCYKLICNSRHGKFEVHDLYIRLGFKRHGEEFRMNF